MAVLKIRNSSGEWQYVTVATGPQGPQGIQGTSSNPKYIWKTSVTPGTGNAYQEATWFLTLSATDALGADMTSFYSFLSLTENYPFLGHLVVRESNNWSKAVACPYTSVEQVGSTFKFGISEPVWSALTNNAMVDVIFVPSGDGFDYYEQANPPTEPVAAGSLWLDTDDISGAVQGEYRLTASTTVENALTTIIPITAFGTIEGGLTISAGEVTVPKSGIYQLSGWASWMTPWNATGFRLFYFYVNGASYIRTSAVPNATTASTHHVVFTKRLAAGDKLSMWVHQTSTAQLKVDNTNNATGMSVFWLRA